MPEIKPLPTIWTAPDALWNALRVVLAEYDPPARTGRKRSVEQRLALDGILSRMRTGCPWNALPPQFGNDTSVYRPFRQWEERGLLDRLWALRTYACEELAYACEELGGVDWQGQAADARMGKARGVPKPPGDPANGRAAKRGRTRRASAPTPPTAPGRASRPACLSRAAAGRLRPASPGPTA